MSTRTISPNSFFAAQTAQLAPTLPAPTTVSLFRNLLVPFRLRLKMRGKKLVYRQPGDHHGWEFLLGAYRRIRGKFQRSAPSSFLCFGFRSLFGVMTWLAFTVPTRSRAIA